MAQTFYAPQPGRLGTAPMLKDSQITTGTLAAGTATFNEGGSPIKSWIDRAQMCAQVYPTAATSCVATISKVTGATVVVLTSALDINAKPADVPLAFTFLTTTTDAQRTLNAGDSLRLTLVTVGAVSVQPTELTLTTSLLALL